jgi:hypothetical protein
MTTDWNKEALIAFMLGLAILMAIVCVTAARAQTTDMSAADTPASVGFWDTLGQWWNDFLSWFTFTGVKGDILAGQNPNTPTPLSLGWSNKNHTIVEKVSGACQGKEVCDAKNGSCWKPLEICTIDQSRTIIDDSWQTASTATSSIDLNRDYYWIMNDGKAVGVSKTKCDGNLPDKQAITLKNGCDYLILDTALNDRHENVIIADKQDVKDIIAKKPVQNTDALSATMMKVAG